MKIVIVAPEALPVPPVRGGATETVIEEVAARLQGHRVEIASIADPSLPRLERKDHRTYHRYRWRLSDRVLSCSWKLPYTQRTSRWYGRPYSHWAAELVRRIQPDVVWVHSRMPFVPWLRDAAPKTRLILSIHNDSNLDGDRIWNAQTIGAVDIVTGCGAGLTRRIMERHPATNGKCDVLYNGVDIRRFRPWWERRAERVALRESQNMRQGPVLLFAGRFMPEKGVHLLLDAFVLLRERYPDAKLILAGAEVAGDERSATYARDVQARAASLGDNVRLVGQVSREEMPDYFLVSDLVVLPSVWDEPFGLVVVEAMATGLPVVAFEAGGPAEVVRSGHDGWLVPRGDAAEGLANAMTHLVEQPDEAHRLGREARRTVEARFTWEAMAARFLELCEQELPRARRRSVTGSTGWRRVREHILIAESGSGYGGTAKYLLELASLLDPERYEVTVVAESEGPFITKLRGQGVPVVMRPSWRFPWRLRALGPALSYPAGASTQLALLVPTIACWLSARRIRLVHLNNELLTHIPLLLAARLAGCKVVCHFHGWRPLTSAERWAVRYVDRLVCISEAGAAYHRDQLGGREVLAIPNGLRLNGCLTQGESRRAEQRRRFGLGPEKLAIGLIGRLVEWKGHRVYLQALAGLIRRVPSAVGVVIGHDPNDDARYLKELQALTKTLGLGDRVGFFPWQEDIWAVYAAIDVLVHASVEPEPFGLVILEAMAAGKPVVATRAGGVVDLVVHGATGLLVPPNDPAALEAAMVRCCMDESLRARLGEAARERAVTRFTMERNVFAISRVYDDMLQRGSGVRGGVGGDGWRPRR